jgi:RNA polymerase sigma-70 factor (sigma-E family)
MGHDTGSACRAEAGTGRSTVTCDRRASSGKFAARYRRSDATDTAGPRSQYRQGCATFSRSASCSIYVERAARLAVTRAVSDDSFEEFVESSSARLFTTARLLTGGDLAAAEDLLQGAYERAYRHWTRICRRAEPERYVRQILVNASVDRWRGLRRRPEVPLLADVEADTRSSAAAVEDRDLLLRGLAGLPSRQRAVLVLRYFEDLTLAQIAAVLGCTVGTVKSQAARGLARLRASVEGAERSDFGAPSKGTGHDD